MRAENQRDVGRNAEGSVEKHLKYVTSLLSRPLLSSFDDGRSTLSPRGNKVARSTTVSVGSCQFKVWEKFD